MPAWALLIIILPVAITTGLVGGNRALGLGTGDMIIVGNTAGTLSNVIRINGALVLFGAGDSRSDLADLVGRSTYPWNDRVHLLIIPGWDDRHVVGALGLIERGQVEALIILGNPGADAIWTTLERAAEAEGTELQFLTGSHRIPVANGTTLTLAVEGPDGGRQSTGALAFLQADQVHIVMLDGSGQALDTAVDAGLIPDRTHLMITTRPTSNLSTEASVLIRPRPQSARDLTASPARYEAELQRGSRLSIRLETNELRIPLDRLTRVETLN